MSGWYVATQHGRPISRWLPKEETPFYPHSGTTRAPEGLTQCTEMTQSSRQCRSIGPAGLTRNLIGCADPLREVARFQGYCAEA
jgi:hypothetical protein